MSAFDTSTSSSKGASQGASALLAGASLDSPSREDIGGALPAGASQGSQVEDVSYQLPTGASQDEEVSYQLPAGEPTPVASQGSQGEDVSSQLPTGASQGSPGERTSFALPAGSFLLLEDHVSGDLVASQGPLVHSVQTAKSESFRGTHVSDTTESYIGWMQKISTGELLSPIASPRGFDPQHSGFYTDLDNSGTQHVTYSYIEQPAFRQRKRAERPGFKSPSLRIGSRGRTLRRVSDPSGSIPTLQKTLPLPASSAARAAPPALVDLQTHRVLPSVRKRMARRLEQRLGGPVLDTQGLRRILGDVAKEAVTEISRGDLCMRHLLRSLGHCDALLHEIAVCAAQARKLPMTIRQLREEASRWGTEASILVARRLLQRAVRLETLHSRLAQSLLKALTTLGVGTSACCSLGHGMDRVPLPSLARAAPETLGHFCHRCKRTADDLLCSASQEAPYEPWWKCRTCEAKSRCFLLCAECGRCAQGSATEALLSKPVTQSWNNCMQLLREFLSPSEYVHRASETGSACDGLTVEAAETGDASGTAESEIKWLEVVNQDSSALTSEMELLPSSKSQRCDSARSGSQRSGSASVSKVKSPQHLPGPENCQRVDTASGVRTPQSPDALPSEGAEQVDEQLHEAAPSPETVPPVPSASSEKSVPQPDPEAGPDTPDVGESDGQSGSAEARFQFPATFLTCPDDASVVSSVSLEDPQAEPMPEPRETLDPTRPLGLDLFVKPGDLWTPRPMAAPAKEAEQRWVLDLPKTPVVERRTFTKKLKLPVGPGLEKVILMHPRTLEPPRNERPRIHEAADDRRRDQQGFEANCCAKELLRRAQKTPSTPPSTYAVAPKELFDGNVQEMDMPVWQGVVDTWNRKIRAAAKDGTGATSAPPADDAMELAAQTPAADAASRRSAPEAPPARSSRVRGKYRVLNVAQIARQAIQAKRWVDPDDVVQHYFEQACQVRRRVRE